MRRRPIGVAGLQRSAQQKEQFRELGNQLAVQQFQQLESQMEQFKNSLQLFATKYKKRICKDPQFRLKFQQMCAMIGVDPLASSKGFWGDLLGIGEFYYELAIRVVEICLSRGKNGAAGLISLKDLFDFLNNTPTSSSSSAAEPGNSSKGSNYSSVSATVAEASYTTAEDIERAVQILAPLGTGLRIVTLCGKSFVASHAPGVSSVALQVLQICAECSCAPDLPNAHLNQSRAAETASVGKTPSLAENGADSKYVCSRIGLVNEDLAEMYLLLLLDEGRVWVDLQSPSKRAHYSVIYSFM